MSDSDPISRRAVVNAAGLGAASAALAGCIDESSVDDPESSGDDEPSSDETEPAAAEGTDDGTEPTDDASDDEGADENGNESGGDDTYRIEPGTEIVFRADSLTWRGEGPDDIEDVENPTLELTEGETYTIGWDEGDGQGHNIALYDDSRSAIEATELTAEPDYESQSIEFEATSEIAEYVCEPHVDSGMRGDIEIASADGTDDENRDRSQFEIDPGTQIELAATTADWEGISPRTIDGESNPTLVLERGETYAIGWTQGDGTYHNIEIRNEDDEVVDDLSTDVVGEEEPDDQWLEFEASEEMAIYACAPHEVTMRGEIRIAD